MADLSWLGERGYAMPSSLKLVGDRHGLTARQRIAVRRSACSDRALADRRARCVEPEALAGREVHVDGYNLLITIESALAGGVILAGRDGAFRDLASMHGSYRTMAETAAALELIGRTLHSLGAAPVRWALDSPVSNSGRLAKRMDGIARESGWDWSVQLLPDPDRALIDSDGVVVSSDSVVLDGCSAWVNLARHIIVSHVGQAWIVDLG